MSRSAPNEIIPNPSTRWLEWSGSVGQLKYYDKTAKQNIDVALPFEFILLDQLNGIQGWHDASEANIYANEVRDTRNETFVVKSFKMKEPIAEGFYSQIRDKVKANGGYYVASLYIAFTNDSGNLALGNLRFHGAASGAWMDFSQDKGTRPFLYKSGIKIGEAQTGKKGGITFKVPKFELVTLPQDVNDRATALDVDLQTYLRSYFKRTRVEQVEPDGGPSQEDENADANRELAEVGTGGMGDEE